jgi:hypothetical protein
MMDERFLKGHRREPRPEFSRPLRARLRQLEQDERLVPAPRFAPALAAFGVLALAAALFFVPSVRVAAQSVLDLFRVRTFTAVQFDPVRIDKLKAMAGSQGGEDSPDPAMLGIERTEWLKKPGEPVVYPSVAAAGVAARLASVRMPGWLPSGMRADTIEVQGESAARLTVRTARLRQLLDGLDLRDVQVPSGLDGQQITVHMPPALIQSFRSGGRTAHLLQATSPQVTLPPGADLARLGEIGLRILGLDPGEAHRMAQAIDWRTTLVVPVPMNAASFRQVSVQGHPGLLITTSGGTGSRRLREGTMLLWTEADLVLAMGGDVREFELMQMAESLR